MIKKTLLAVALLTFICGSAFAVDFTGKWTGSVKTPGGLQNYVIEIAGADANLTVTATCNDKPSALTDVKLNGDKLTFTEPAKIMGMDIKVLYTGKLDGEKIKFARKIGVLGNDELVVTKVK
jgi:hypothetical protein